jgi:hypothetical protein
MKLMIALSLILVTLSLKINPASAFSEQLNNLYSHYSDPADIPQGTAGPHTPNQPPARI